MNNNSEPTNYVQHLHNIPRFGHTRSIASLLVGLNHNNDSEKSNDEYKDGIVAFCVFLSILFIIWMIILLVLKFAYGNDKVGCAAGGNVVNIRLLKKLGIKKSHRKQRIIRSWRIQTAFLFATSCIPPLCFCLFQIALTPLLKSLQDVQDINNDIESKAYFGVEVTANFIKQKQQIIQLQRESNYLTIDPKTICPKSVMPSDGTNNTGNIRLLSKQHRTKLLESQQKDETNTITNSTTYPLNQPITIETNEVILNHLSQLQENVHGEMSNLEFLWNMNDTDLFMTLSYLYQITNVTAAVDGVTESIYNHDWILKLFACGINICVGFFIFGVLLTKHNIQWPAYQAMMTYGMVPSFCLLLIGFIYGTCIFVSFAIMNADFCSGGSSNSRSSSSGSPAGTLTDMLFQSGYKENNLIIETLDYYANTCLSENPLTFIDGIQDKAIIAHLSIRDSYMPFQEMNMTNDNEFTNECGSEGAALFQNYLDSVGSFVSILDEIQGSLKAAIDLTECSSISPILRRLSYGSTCTTSVEGVTWLFVTLLCISIFGMTSLSLRAALYNTIIRGRRQKRREKEFEDYKEFMSRFYDVAHWKLDPNVLTPAADSVEKKYDNEDDDDDDDDDDHTTSTATAIENFASGTTRETDSTSTTSDEYSIAPATTDDLNSLAPTVTCRNSKNGDSTTFVNLAAPDKYEPYHSVDDDDDSYDSTYSSDSDETAQGSIHSSSTSYLIQRIFSAHKRRQSVAGLLSLSPPNLQNTKVSEMAKNLNNAKGIFHNSTDEKSIVDSSFINPKDILSDSPEKTVVDSSFINPKDILSDSASLFSGISDVTTIRGRRFAAAKHDDPLDLGRHQLESERSMKKFTFNAFNFFNDSDDEGSRVGKNLDFSDDDSSSIGITFYGSSKPKVASEMRPLSPAYQPKKYQQHLSGKTMHPESRSIPRQVHKTDSTLNKIAQPNAPQKTKKSLPRISRDSVAVTSQFRHSSVGRRSKSKKDADLSNNLSVFWKQYFE